MFIRKLNLALLCASAAYSGQIIANENESGRFAFAGYGDVKYEDSDALNNNSFSARFVPIFLFSLNDKLHVEAETEISIDENGETETELEYADIHYFVSNNTTITAGKFLLPFGQYGPNQHPSWINRSAFSPGIYGGLGGHGGYQPMQGLLPVLSDIGVGVQHIVELGDNQKLFFDFYYTNGLSPEAPHDEGEEDAHAEEEIEDEHAEEPEGSEEDDHGEEEDVHEEEEEEHAFALPELAFEATSSDNNSDKAFGGRIAYAFLPGIEVGASYYSAKYDDEGRLGFKATGFDLNIIGDYYLVRGEYIKTETDAFAEVEDEHEDQIITSFDRNGWYLQGTLMAGKFFESLQGTEFVLEYAETNKINEAQRWAYGVNYWLDSRTVIKATYEDTDIVVGNDDKRFAVQVSYGF